MSADGMQTDPQKTELVSSWPYTCIKTGSAAIFGSSTGDLSRILPQ